ncbi:right-handed parallel beta-helix repeat-containing protein [Treponema primitia]|uniref:choice-of-anchor Q domain-containing protein n=1 Tax=Treponema primitia TaxID=88058 RepID=UPI00397EA84A
MRNTGIILVLVISSLLGSCDLFINKPERNILTDIEESVWNAKAPQLEVFMDVPQVEGTSVPPTGPMNPQPKLRIPFRVFFTPTEDYVFVKWQAFDLLEKTEKLVTDSKLVFFADENNPDTTAEVRVEQPFRIKPLAIERPKVESVNLPNSTFTRVPTNYPIRIRFKNPVARETIITENISVIAKGDYGRSETAVDLFGDGEGQTFNQDSFVLKENGTLLEIVPIANKNLPITSDITITLKGGIGAQGYPAILMLRESSFVFGTGPSADTTPPTVSNIRGASLRSFDSDGLTLRPNGIIGAEYATEDRRILGSSGNRRTVYIMFNATDEYSEVKDFYILEKRVNNLNGGPVSDDSDHKSAPQPAIRQSALAEPQTQKTVLAHTYNGEFNMLPYLVEYDLQTTESGIIDLYILPSDTLLGMYDTEAQARASGNYLRVVLNREGPIYTGTVPLGVSGGLSPDPTKYFGGPEASRKMDMDMSITGTVTDFTSTTGISMPSTNDLPWTKGSNDVKLQFGVSNGAVSRFGAWTPISNPDPITPTTSGYQLSLEGLPDGKYKPVLRITDALTSPWDDTVNFNEIPVTGLICIDIDTTPPVITSPTLSHNGTGATLNWSGYDANAYDVIIYQTNPPDSAVTISGTSNTYYKAVSSDCAFEIKAVDILGNTSATVTLTLQKHWYVKAVATGTGTGSSWTNASGDLQKMIDQAREMKNIFPGNDLSVLVGAGTYIPLYKPNSDGTTNYSTPANDPDAVFILREGISILGAYDAAGGDLDEPTRQGRFNTDGTPKSESYRATLNGNNARSHVVLGVGLTAAAKLDGFTITGGNANGSGSLSVNSKSILRYRGGGMYNDDSSPTLTRLVIRDNTGVDGGGMANTGASTHPILDKVNISGNVVTGNGAGIYNLASSSPTLQNGIIQNNTAGTNGGGMYNNGSSPILIDVTIKDNTSNSSSGGGGGIHNLGASSPNLTRVSFVHNIAANSGGGIYNTGSSSPIFNVGSIELNEAGTNGGGMYNSGSASTLTGVTISGNKAATIGNTGGGGGIYNTNSSLTITGVTIKKNSAVNGGGILNSNSSPTLTNVNISGNSAGGQGGGISDYTSSFPVLTNVTISGNKAGTGGGMYNASSSNPQIRNSIIWGNSSSISNTYGTPDPIVTYSIVEGGHPGDSNRSDNPQFISPLDPGVAPSDGGNYRLQSGSPAINAGSNSYYTSGTTDLDGYLRLVGAAVDMGAYEYHGP